jgi:endonuclease/exonuclease/phosphatase family metal-dependent hydrolase
MELCACDSADGFYYRGGMRRSHFHRFFFIPLMIWARIAFAAETFTVATYNVENYLDAASGTRSAKPVEARAAVRSQIRALGADVLALQEMGNTNALLELRSALKVEGLDYPHWEHVAGYDTNIYVAVLSRFPIVARRPHTNEGYLLGGRRLRVSRGFAEVDIQVSPQYTFTLLTAHLKSRRPVGVADETEMREEEAQLLRAKVDARLKANPNVNLVVLGDFNDVKDAKSTRKIIGRGSKAGLVDTRPAEAAGAVAAAAKDARTVTWTYYYAKEDTYARIDYLLLSHGMAREWDAGGTRVLATPNWGEASDHRPVVARFWAENR